MIDRIARVLADADPRRGGILGFLGGVDWALVARIVLAILGALGCLSPAASGAAGRERLPESARAAIRREFPEIEP